tara:strand:- start:587 stop:775 length:189 start_codon:yes stop_codon:yes gene_type:complete
MSALQLLLETLFIGCFIHTTLGGIVEVCYNVKSGGSTPAHYWFIPALFGMAFWFTHYGNTIL